MNQMKTSFDILHWLAAPAVIPGLIDRGVVTQEEMEEAAYDYHDFLTELEKEWPPERIKEWVVEEKRRHYQNTAKYIQKLELDNRDARVRGVSYKEREKTFTAKMATARKVLAQVKQEGLDVKKQTFAVRELVSPLDVPFIESQGFEKHIRYKGLGHLALSPTPLALSPAKV